MDSLWLSDKKLFYNSGTDVSDFETDVCVVGAGIFGVTCAYYLSKLGFRVAVLEKDFVGSKTSGHTTGKITSQHGLFFKYLVDSYGKDFAKGYLDANEEAIENIKKIIDFEGIKCDFKRQNSFVYATNESELEAVMDEFRVLQDLGFDCDFVTKTGLPFEVLRCFVF